MYICNNGEVDEVETRENERVEETPIKNLFL